MSKRSTITPTEFVTIWQNSATAKIAFKAFETFGLKSGAATARASSYRTKGIPLKTFNKGSGMLDVAALTALAETLND
jgi:hypothetical protein